MNLKLISPINMIINNELLLLLTIPIIGIIFIIICKKNSREIGLIASLINLLISLILLITYDYNSSYQYQYIYNYNDYIYLGIDGISLIFILLTTFIMSISILGGWENKNKTFIILILILEFLLIGTFSSIDLFIFYIFFEFSLIPMFLLIGIYGNRERKIYASFILFMYTFIGSLILLIGFLLISNILGTSNYIELINFNINKDLQIILFILFFFSFAIKTPIIPFHIWLPDAHSEAPLTGSIILAGILLKLGTYGLLRIIIGLLPYGTLYFTPLIYALSIISIIYGSLSTLRQIDFKKIIAYSSIPHMAIINLGLFSNTIQGIEGSIILVIMHGVVSPALFILVNILYSRYHNRIILYYQGIVNIMPFFSFIFLLFILGNIGFPITGNFIGEMMSLIGSFNYNYILTIISALGLILSGFYSIWMYNRIIFGKISKYILPTYDILRIELHLLLPLIILLILFGIYPNIIINIIENSISYYII